jgi:hypothetical protein
MRAAPAQRIRAIRRALFVIFHLKRKADHVSQIKGKSHGQNMEYPPSRFIPHEIFEHVYLHSRCPRV